MTDDESPIRCWSLAGAREILAEVRRHTSEAVTQIGEIDARRSELPAGSSGRKQLDDDVHRAVAKWTRAMEALGVEVHGSWRVGFDNGEGYFCWRWPEPEIAYFRGYDDEDDARARIQ
ncbi:MAG: DUF2203 family protein [Myxococcota bacterium]